MSVSHGTRARYATVGLLALLYTLLNVPKPLQVDDAAYFYFAQQFARDPAHPYDFKIFWYSQPDPANVILAPPVLPAWWSLAYRVAPDSPWVWKLWLLPFTLLFVGALDALFRRFCPGVSQPLLLMTVLSPTFLPSLNLMLDVPALALSLTSIVVFLWAAGQEWPRHWSVEGERSWDAVLLPPLQAWGLAALAGLLAGLAMQTKYTGVVAPAVMILAGLFFWRPTLAILSGAVASAVFIAWELFLIQQQGESHFWVNLPGKDPQWWDHKSAFLILLAPIIGGVTPAVTLLGLVALRLRWVALVIGLLLLSSLVAVVCLPTDWFWENRQSIPLVEAMTSMMGGLNERVIFALDGWLLASVVLAATAQLGFPWRRKRKDSDEPSRWPIGLGSRTAWFLIAWLALELVAYVFLTPFGAVRRVMGLVVVITLCFGHLASQTCQTVGARRVVNAVAIVGILLGFLFYKVDLDDAFAEKDAVETAAQVIHAADPKATIWYTGHWGFQYAAEHAGMKAACAGQTDFNEGDWLVVPDFPVHSQPLEIDPNLTKVYRFVEIPQGLPLRCVMTYYGGYHSIEQHYGPRLVVTIYQITASHRAR